MIPFIRPLGVHTAMQNAITRDLLERSQVEFRKRMETVKYAKHETAPQDRLLVQMNVFLEVLKGL